MSRKTNILNEFIPGGYVLKARKTSTSEIQHCSPVVREVWDYLLMHASHQPIKVGKYMLRRGQQLSRIQEIRENLSWYVGYRLQRYTKDAVNNALRKLRCLSMITTQKTPRGMIISICNYDKYQTPGSYSTPNDYLTEDSSVTPIENQVSHSTVQKGNNIISQEKKKSNRQAKPTREDVMLFFTGLSEKNATLDPISEAEKFFDHYSANGWKVGGKSAMKDWQASARNWIRNVDKFSGNKKGKGRENYMKSESDFD